MRELPEPDLYVTENFGLGDWTNHIGWTRDQVLAIQKQAYEDALMDAAEVALKTVCDVHLPTGVRIYGSRAAEAIQAMLTASKKEQQ